MSGSSGRHLTDAAQPAAMPALAGLLMVAQRLARSPSRCFLIGGDVGVGKRTLASFIHRQSTRANRPYLVADLAAIAPEQLDHVLFGSDGLLVNADGGTLLLQEITILPNRLQRTLLQVLQERTFETPDTGQVVTVDVRVIVTSNYDLEGADGAMLREDLRYRITAVQLHVPPLRHRRDDVLALATHFLLNANVGAAGPAGFARDAIDALQTYSWPNNVHELRLVIETAVATMVRHGRKVLVASDLNLPIVPPASFPRSSRPPPSSALTFAVGSTPALELAPTREAGAPDDAPWQGPQCGAPTLQGISAESLWDELQRHGLIE
jgi:DNA-binding NtrC family response regulator